MKPSFTRKTGVFPAFSPLCCFACASLAWRAAQLALNQLLTMAISCNKPLNHPELSDKIKDRRASPLKVAL